MPNMHIIKKLKLLTITVVLLWMSVCPGHALLVIDPGHGGSEPGATAVKDGQLIYEKDLNLNIALKSSWLLKNHGFETTLTRTGDIKVELKDRVALSNRLPTDFFISIHNNSFLSSLPRGVEVYYYKSNSEGKRLAELIAASISEKTGIPNRGAKPTDNLYVIINTRATAVLIECGFMSNPDDLAILVSQEGQQRIAAAISDAIVNYVREKFLASKAYERIFGRDRIETACLLSRKHFSEAEYAVLVNGFAVADSICAAPLAGALSAPVLFVTKNNLHATTLEELKRLKVRKVILVGGYGVISKNIEGVLEENGFTVERLYGLDRYQTAARVAGRLSEIVDVSSVFIVNGESCADAASCGAAANRGMYPVLYVKKDNMPFHTGEALKAIYARNESLEVVVVGGEGVVSNTVYNQAGAKLRLWGKDRYATNIAVQIYALEKGIIKSERVFVGNGLDPADILAASCLGSRLGQIVILSPKSYLPGQSFSFLDKVTGPETLFTMLGGPQVIDENVERKLSVIWLNN